MTTDPAHILLVDDDERLRALLFRFLRGEGYVLSTAADAAQASALLEFFRVDLIILDYMLPGTDGVSALKQWRGNGLHTPVLMLTALGETDHRILGLEAGADDYLAKPFEPKELALRLRSLLRRRGGAAAQETATTSLQLGTWHYTPGSAAIKAEDGEILSLTNAETNLLDTLAAQLNNAVSREALINEHRDSSRAVDAAVSRLRRKLGGAEWLQSVRGVGYRLVGRRNTVA